MDAKTAQRAHLSVGGVLEIGNARSGFPGQPLSNGVGNGHCAVSKVAMVKVQAGVPHSQDHALPL